MAKRSMSRWIMAGMRVPGTLVACGVLAAAQPAQAQQRSYPVVDTGQASCYDEAVARACPAEGSAFHGQDAQHMGAQPRYQDNGDGTVSDLVTGLMWQQTPGAKATFAQATARAESFELAGHGDWRLPTIKELYSLIDFRGLDPSGWRGSDTSSLVPFIDTDFFDFEYGSVADGQRLIDAQYWSSTAYVSTTMNGDATVFGVNFADGRIKGYPRDRGPDGRATSQFVRYVRGNPDYGHNRFVDQGDGTVTDEATGLMWARADSGQGLDWAAALAYAEGLDLAGHGDWRLPNAKELQSIVDYGRAPATDGSPAIDAIFESTAIVDEGGKANFASYWTSTTHVNMSRQPGGYAAYLAFGEALGFMELPPGSGSVRLLDVHGAGAQRSDPKAGDPSDWPTGHGPQGDVIRIYNLVRAVRDISPGSAPTPRASAQPSPSHTPPIPPSATLPPSATPPSATAPPVTPGPPTDWRIYLPLTVSALEPVAAVGADRAGLERWIRSASLGGVIGAHHLQPTHLLRERQVAVEARDRLAVGP